MLVKNSYIFLYERKGVLFFSCLFLCQDLVQNKMRNVSSA